MHELDLSLAYIGLVVLVLGLVTTALRRYWLSKPLLAFAAGVAIGPLGLGLLSMTDHSYELMEWTARLTLAVVLVSVGARLPPGYLRRQWRTVTAQTVGSMLLMGMISALLLRLLLGVEWITAILIGAIVTPTDPVLAGAVVSGKLAEDNLPQHLRSLLKAESGANDGVAYLFVLLPILLLQMPAPSAWEIWFTRTLLLDVVLAVAVGLVLGYLVGKAQNWSVRHKLSIHSSLMSLMLALALATMGLGRLMGSDALLSVFAAGVMLAFVHSGLREEQAAAEEVVLEVFQLPIFVMLGVLLPWQQWLKLSWAGVAAAVLVPVLRRLPAVMLLKPMLGGIRWKEAAFLGWFGPVGVSAIYYAMLAHRKLHQDSAWAVTSLIVVGSLVVHGITATPFTVWLGRHVGMKGSSDQQ